MASARRIRGIFRRIRGQFGNEPRESELAAEVQHHLEILTERNVAKGMPLEEARYAAARHFGGVEQIKEQARDQLGVSWIRNLGQDFRYGLRTLRRNRAFTATAMLVLTLSIGASTAIFSIVNAVVIHPFSYPRPDRLVAVLQVVGQAPFYFSATDYAECQRQSTVFTALGAARFRSVIVTGVGQPMRAFLEQVTANFFSILGVSPLVGRDFRPEDQAPGAGGVVILSHVFWLEHFGGRPDVVGEKVLIDDVSVTIIGVMPRDFQDGSAAPGLYMPVSLPAAQRTNTFASLLVGRLKDHATSAQANEELAGIAKQLPRINVEGGPAKVLSATSLEEYTVGYARPMLLTLFGAVACLQLIACVNLAGLLLARTISRQKEIFIRLALGASRRRIIRQLLCESLLLAMPAGLIGIGLAWVALKLPLQWVLPGDLPRVGEISIDAAAMVFGGAMVVVAGIGFGLVPALLGTRMDLSRALKGSSQGASEGRRERRLRSALVMAEVAVSVILLFGAGQLIRSFFQYEYTSPGYSRRDLYWTPLVLPDKKYREASSQVAFVTEAVKRLSAVPGVDAAFFIARPKFRPAGENVPIQPGSAMQAPLARTKYGSDGFGRIRSGLRLGGVPLLFSSGAPFNIAGHPFGPPGASAQITYGSVTADYVEKMGIPLLRGRTFTADDIDRSSPVILINEEMARRYFHGQEPIGQLISFDHGTAAEIWREVIGVVGSVRVRNWGMEDSIGPFAYIPISSEPAAGLELGVRITPGSPINVPAICAAVHAVDPDVAITNLWRVDATSVRGVPAIRRLSMALGTVLSVISLLLVTTGVYGVVSCNVIQRTNEIGLRIALGAQRGNVLRFILGHAARSVGLGLLLGSAGALITVDLIGNMLFQVSPYDPVTFGAGVLVIAFAGLAACWLPARRATRLNVMVALRCE